MKRFWLGLILLAVPAWCGTSVTMDGPMTDVDDGTVGIAGPVRSYPVNMDDHNIDYASIQIAVSSGNYTAATFSDGRASTMTMAVASYAALSTAAATGQFTMVSTSVASGVTGTASVAFKTNNGNSNVLITGPPGGLNYTMGGNVAVGNTSSNTAVNFAAAVNLSSNTSLVTATQSGSSAIVTLTCVNAGTFCNSYAVTSSSSAQVSTAAFSGGTNPVQITIGPNVYRAVADFSVGTSTALMAVNLATLVAASSATTLVDSTATASCIVAPSLCGIVYATYTVTGSAGNIALGSSNSLAISTSGYKMTGGQDNASFCINGTCLTANTHWYPQTSNIVTAQKIYAAINSSFTIVVSTEHGGTVYTTSTIVGTAANYAITSSTQGNLTISPYTSSSTVTGGASGFMYGGAASSYTILTSSIKIPSHGFPTALLVSISSTTGNQALYYSTAVVGTQTLLSFGSTWYVIPVDANTIALSKTSTGAVAGISSAIVLASSATPTIPDVWTVNIATPVGASAYGFYESNNGVDFTQIGSSFTFANGSSFIYPSSNTYIDYGNYDWKWLQLNIAPPATSGAMVIKTWLHGEKR